MINTIVASPCLVAVVAHTTLQEALTTQLTQASVKLNGRDAELASSRTQVDEGIRNNQHSEDLLAICMYTL